jgi:hypothetical protein
MAKKKVANVAPKLTEGEQALQGRGLIRAAKGHDPLTIIWRLKKK